ncbi:MAG: VCBS repeat-containing protein [Deltaproteobacteria bacterium]|nr:VCBS repeat-containing protein [Deltaproteobacteria bacterium]
MQSERLDPRLPLPLLALATCLACATAASAQEREIGRGRTADGATVALVRETNGDGTLTREGSGETRATPIACERLEGAWGLWIADVDGDGRSELIVALRKRARFDPVVENRLHVYTLSGSHCVPLWRGTRLAGRFDALAIERDPDGADRVVAWERTGTPNRTRLARYRWADFGFVMERVIWSGAGSPPPPWRERLQTVEGSAPGGASATRGGRR